jgi:hypothetical protein
VHLNRGPLGWGVCLITLGGLVLAARAGLLPDVDLSQAWPFAFVGLGLILVLASVRRHPRPPSRAEPPSKAGSTTS